MNDTPENRQELDPNKLFEPPDACDYYVYDPRLKSLPFEQVSWQSFEKLSARLLEALFGSRFLQVFGYGRSGQAQYGIDIIALKPGSVKQTVMQCKNVREVKRGQLHTWVKQFLANKKASDSDHYILCIPFAVNEDAKLVEEWAEQALLLDRHEINAELWGLDKLNELLREQASLVEIFFGEKIASGFCSRARIPDKYPARYRREFEAQYDNSVVLENEIVRLDAFVPDERAARLAATLSFARSDLSGITFTVPSTTLLEWLQWIAHADDLSKAPYVTLASGQKGRYIFCAPDIRLMLDNDELCHLHWVFKRAWIAYISAAKSLESKWRFLRFNPIQDTQQKTFGLAKISRQLWRSFLSFAQEHDCRQGESVWHIFDRAPGILKVYVDHRTDKLERGYHLIMRAYQDGGFTLPHEDSIIIGWSPLTSISDEPLAMHPRLAWDAEFTYDWVFCSLLPAVREWIVQKETQRQNSQSGFFAKFLSIPHIDIDLSSHIYSLQAIPTRAISSSSPKLSTLAGYAEDLQSYFHVYRRVPDISGESVLSVLKLLARLVTMIRKPDERYIRGNLQLGDGSLQAELEKLTERAPSTLRNPAWLDMSLRSLIALLRDANELPQSELVLSIETLSPLWERMVEDRLCDTLR